MTEGGKAGGLNRSGFVGFESLRIHLLRSLEQCCRLGEQLFLVAHALRERAQLDVRCARLLLQLVPEGAQRTVLLAQLARLLSQLRSEG